MASAGYHDCVRPTGAGQAIQAPTAYSCQSCVGRPPWRREVTVALADRSGAGAGRLSWRRQATLESQATLAPAATLRQHRHDGQVIQGYPGASGNPEAAPSRRAGHNYTTNSSQAPKQHKYHYFTRPYRLACPDARTDRQTDERTDRRTDRQTDGRTDRQANGRTNGQTDRQMDGSVVKWTNEQTDGKRSNGRRTNDKRTVKRPYKRTVKRTDEWTVKWLDGRTDGRTVKRTDEQTDGQPDGRTVGQMDE